MESIPFTYGQQHTDIQHQQPTTSQIVIPQSVPTTVTSSTAPSTTCDPSACKNIDNQQNIYQVKCSLLEYHIQEALLINKAIKSELKQYKDKIEFENKLRKFLVDRLGGIES